jgi:hypothetical protein
MKSATHILLACIAILALFNACISREDVFELINERPWDGPFALVDVYATSNTGVCVAFNRYVDMTSAKDASHYSIPV